MTNLNQELTVILASRSFRRRMLLSSTRIPFQTIAPDVREISIPDRPEDTARINALAKAEWTARLFPEAIIIAADTVVFLDRILRKPETITQARDMLKKLSGRNHKVFTAVALIIPFRESTTTGIDVSRVRMKKLSDDVITEYFQMVTPLDKAGGYAIQEHGEMLIDNCRGSITNVIGLPMELLGRMLGKYPESRPYAELLKVGLIPGIYGPSLSRKNRNGFLNMSTREKPGNK